MSLLRLYDETELHGDGYPLAWHRGDPTIKDLVRKLAGHRCLRCLHPYRNGRHGNGEWSPCDERCTHKGPYRYEWNGIWEDVSADDYRAVTAGQAKGHIGHRAIHARWRILTVHHLTGIKADCRWWNLAALCQRCHLQIQGKVRMEQVYPHEHSEWFKPYAAGYYAATYLGEDLDREETEARLDELLGLELNSGLSWAVQP